MRSLTKKCGTIVVFILLLSFHVRCQQSAPGPDLRFDNFNGGHNFVSNLAQLIIRSKSGYIWIGSNGLYRFDGRVYERYSYFFNAEHKYTDYDISDIMEDPSQRIWVGCKSGICYFDQFENKFHYIDSGKITDADGLCLIGNSLWFLSNFGLSSIDLTTLKVTNITADFLFAYNADKVDDNTIICLGNNSYYLYRIKENKWEKVQLGADNAAIMYSYVKIGKAFFFGTSMGIWVSDNIYNQPTYVDGTKDLEPRNISVAPSLTGDSVLWIKTQTKGLILYNLNQKRIQYSYVHDVDNPNSISSNTVNNLFIDDRNMVWVATACGISLFNPQNQSLKVHLNNDKNIMKAVQDRFAPNNLWISIYGKGLAKIDWQTKRETAQYNPLKDKKDRHSPVADVGDMWQISKNKWLLLSIPFMTVWDTRSGAKQEVGFPANTSKNIRLNWIIPYNGDSCFITSNMGLYVFNIKTGKADTIFTISKEARKSGLNNILNGAYDGNKELWMGTRRGLLNYNIATGEKNIYRMDNRSERNNAIQSVAIFNRDKKVICPSAGGVAVFDIVLKKFMFFDHFAEVKNPICRFATIHDSIAWISFSGGILTLNLNNWATGIATSNEQIHSVDAEFVHMDDVIVAPMRNMFCYFTPDLIKNTPWPSTPIIEKVIVNNKVNYFPGKPISLKYYQNSIGFHFSAFYFYDPDHIHFRYKLEGLDSAWSYLEDERDVNYIHLPHGKYSFVLQSGNSKGYWNASSAIFAFEIVPAFWQTWWFKILLLVSFIALVTGIAGVRIRSIKKRETERTATNKEIAEMELKALRSQMNPHFIFNSLNSIQKFIWENKQEDAAEYLAKFSKLIRMILDNSMHKWITLEQEINTISLYLELEHRRCNNKFDYVINIDSNVDASVILFPPLILQPYVENAIWHGLLNKEGRGDLKISIEKKDDSFIECIIEDNGVGRKAAGEIKGKRESNTISYGTDLTSQRLAMINEQGKKGEVKIEDLYDMNGIATGTRVVIDVPISTFVKI